MGLESINFFFHSEEPFEKKLQQNSMFNYSDTNKFIYKMDSKYWIDIEMLDLSTASIRIMLSNPTIYLFDALDRLLLFFFELKKPTLMDMVSKQVYHTYDITVKENLESSFLERRIIFESMYGDYIAAIGVDEFYNKNLDN